MTTRRERRELLSMVMEAHRELHRVVRERREEESRVGPRPCEPCIGAEPTRSAAFRGIQIYYETNPRLSALVSESMQAHRRLAQAVQAYHQASWEAGERRSLFRPRNRCEYMLSSVWFPLVRRQFPSSPCKRVLFSCGGFNG